MTEQASNPIARRRAERGGTNNSTGVARDFDPHAWVAAKNASQTERVGEVEWYVDKQEKPRMRFTRATRWAMRDHDEWFSTNEYAIYAERQAERERRSQYRSAA